MSSQNILDDPSSQNGISAFRPTERPSILSLESIWLLADLVDTRMGKGDSAKKDSKGESDKKDKEDKKKEKNETKGSKGHKGDKKDKKTKGDKKGKSKTSEGRKASSKPCITVDKDGKPFQAPFDSSKFRQVLSECRLQWPTHKAAYPVRRGKFDGYAQADFHQTDEGHMRITVEGKETGQRCELRHNPHWSITAARNDLKHGVRLDARIRLPCPPVNRTESFTFLQIHTAGFVDAAGTKYADGPFLRVTWKRARGKNDKQKDVLYANVREDLRTDGKSNGWYDLDQVRPDGFFDLSIDVVYNVPTKHYELRIDIDGRNRLTKEIDYWSPMLTNYFKAGVYLGGGVDDNVPQATAVFSKLEIDIPTSDDTCAADEDKSDSGSSDDC